MSYMHRNSPASLTGGTSRSCAEPEISVFLLGYFTEKETFFKKKIFKFLKLQKLLLAQL